MRPSRSRAAAAAVAAWAAVGCAGSKPVPRAAVRPAPASDAAIPEGRELAAGLFGRDPLVGDDRLLRYVALVGRTCGGRSVDGWRFAVTQSAVPYATAFPGGIVVVSRGLLLLVRSEAELAVVLSREIHRGETAPAREFPGPAPESGDPARETALDAAGARLASAAGYDAAAFLHLLDMLQDRAASAREKSEIQERAGAYRALPETSAGGRMLAERFRSSAIV
ncbi:MAG TPA: M48 family metalloprotease [Thermoanaerobaculia bacterium]|nr:M48 family metalloprotease [Thermoanaerobaculia bacterium]